MRKIVCLDENLVAEVRKYAAETDRTFDRIVEDALREVLARRRSSARAAPVRLRTLKGNGVRPGVNLDNSASLLGL